MAASAPTTPVTPVNPAFDNEIRTLLKSGQQLITINGCSELYRARLCVQQIGATMKEPYTVFVWNPSRGFTWNALDANRNMKPLPFLEPGEDGGNYRDPALALNLIPMIKPKVKEATRAIFVFQNMHAHLEQFVALRDQLQVMVDEGKFISMADDNFFKRPVILLHPNGSLHHELRPYAVPVKFPPANEHDLADAIGYVGTSLLGESKQGACPDDLKSRMASTMLGLTRQQAEDVTAKCIVAKKGWHEDMLVLIEEAKAAQIGQEGFLTYVPRKLGTGLGNIGGWGLAEQFVRRQCQAYTPQGRKMQLPIPKGILALGLPGTGKSMFAKLVGQIVYDTTGQAFPTYKLNYDALFGGIVGETESNVRRLLEILAAQRRYILVVDEMEKFLGTSGSENDGGVSRKASAKFLDWLSERALNTDDDADFGYVIGTMNSLSGLEPEFLRRFNATFFVDLPDPATRLDIFKIQLRLQHAPHDQIVGSDGKALTKGDWNELVNGTDQFSGSEIAGAVEASRLIAAESHGVDIKDIDLDTVDPALAIPTFEQLQEAVAQAGKSTMARVHQERIETIRAWCKDRALPVHAPAAPAATTARRGGRAIDTGN